ncbi:MAG: hypothetical protein WDN44_04045 [Sphingomonas sp.]
MARAAQSAGTAAKPAPAPEPVRQATNVMALLDVVGALGSGTLAGSLFLFDNNRWAGSTGHGTGSLSTVAQPGDVVVWTTMALECEAFARLQLVEIDIAYADYVELDAAAFSETPEVYWLARILKPLPADGVPYRLSYRLGSAHEPYRAPVESRLVPPVAAVPPTPGAPEEPPLDPNQGDAT